VAFHLGTVSVHKLLKSPSNLIFCDIDKEISCIPDEEWDDLLLFYKVTSEGTLPAYMIERLEHDQRIA
jgi:hypothetical protein